jgi:alcohol dehydrogenase
MPARTQALALLHTFKGDHYVCGDGVLPRTGRLARELGVRALVFANNGGWHTALTETILDSLRQAGVDPIGGRAFPGARPNSPREDVYRMEALLLQAHPDLIVAVGGGSVIDAAKAAAALAGLGLACPVIDPLFGAGQVSALAAREKARLIPLLAIQTAAGSAAHLTKYSNITDPVAGQKKLIIDDAIVPARALFDYSLIKTAPASLLVDGVLDGLSHNLEVFLGCPADKAEAIAPVALTGIELLLAHALDALEKRDAAALEGLGLGTDLGGYAIMLGGTNGPHLNSFSFVDVASHGRACGILNLYYTVFFARAIGARLQRVAAVLHKTGLLPAESVRLDGRELGLAVAGGLAVFNRKIGAPTALSDLPGFDRSHIRRALEAARDPALESKLKNMPVPMKPAEVESLMGPLLEAAWAGDLNAVTCLGE